MANTADLMLLDGTAQADLVRRKEIQPIELVDAAIARIERLNPTLNAVITPLFDQARDIARRPLPTGPFTGVPFLLKDILAAYAGVRNTSGSLFLRDSVPHTDSELVVRLRRAGVIVLGKTNAPEFGILCTTEPQAYGPTRNPWNTNHSAGGSSGGSAAAVASRMVAMAHGNDGGGSIRIPASCCGVFGLKPTRARISLGPQLGELMNGLLAEHALTRTVRDSAALLDATAGPALGDPYWAPPPARPFLQEVNTSPGRLRIAFTAGSLAGTAVHPDCVNAVQETATLLAELGHSVVEAAPAVNGDQLVESFLTIWAAGNAWTMDASARGLKRQPEPHELEPLTWALVDIGHKQSAAALVAAETTMQRVSRRVAQFFNDYDVWLTPTITEPPAVLGSFDATPDDPMAGFYHALSYIGYLPLCNVTGQPAMSMPLHWNADNLPIGTHFVGRFGDEATLFRLAAQLEMARPWANRRPPLFG